MSKISFSAPRASASLAAAVSALMLYEVSLSTPWATVETTGVYPVFRAFSTVWGFTPVIRPTRPYFSSICSAWNSCPSMPQRPTARPPRRLSWDTRSLLTFPQRTAWTMSMVVTSV